MFPTEFQDLRDGIVVYYLQNNFLTRVDTPLAS